MGSADVSVIVPTYNSQKYIERTLRSIIKNKILMPNIEIVVINDGSTDHTGVILDKYKDDLKIINHKKNLGLPSALNTGILNSVGQFIVRVDSDDFVLPEYCHILSTFLRLNNTIDAIKCDYLLIDELQNVIKEINSEKEPIGCGIMFRREHLIEIGLYNPKQYLHEDKELVKRFERSYKIVRIPLALYKYFIHGENITIKAKKGQSIRPKS